jgi:hypothetical protein
MASGGCRIDEGEGIDGVSKVSGIQMKSSNKEGNGSSPGEYSELIFDEDTDKEIESFLRHKLVREKDLYQEDVLQTEHANQQTCSTEDDNHANLIKEEVSSFSEINNCMQIETKGCEKRIEMTEASPRKHVQNDGNEKIDDVGVVIENVEMNSLKEVEHSDDLSESKTGEKDNPNIVHTKVLAAEAKPLKVPSTKATSITPMWDNYILAVRGIPPRESAVS